MHQLVTLLLSAHVKSTITLPLPVLWELCRLASEPEPVVVIQSPPRKWVNVEPSGPQMTADIHAAPAQQ